MGAMREELVLFDKFSGTFETFIRLGEDAVDRSQAVDQAVQKMADSGNAAGQAVKNQAAEAQQAANGGFSSLLKKLMAITAAYVSISKMKSFVSDAMSERTYEVRMEGIFGTDAGAAAATWARNTANELGLATSSIFKATTEFTKVSTQPPNIDKFLELSDRFSKLSDGVSFDQMSDAIQDSFLRGSTRSLSSVAGISKGLLEQFQIDDFLQKGDVAGALEALEKAADAAGMTREAFEKITDTPEAKWEKFLNKMQNGATKAAGGFINAFAPAFDAFNNWVDSDKGQAFFRNIEIGATIAGNAAAFFIRNLHIIGPALGGILGMMAAYKLATMGAAAAIKIKAAAQWALNAAQMASPTTWIVLGIIALVAIIYIAVAAYNNFAGTSVSATGIILGAISVLGAFVYNIVVAMWNVFAAFANFFGNVFNNPVAAIKVLFFDLAQTVIGYVLNMAKAIENIINKIPGVKVNITSGLESFQNKLTDLSQKVKDESGWVEYVGKMDYMDFGDAFNQGYTKGSDLASSIGDLAGGIDAFNRFTDGIDKIGGDGNVDSVGRNKDPIRLDDESMRLYTELAERDYVIKINHKTLTPQIKVDVTNQNGEPLDENKIVNSLKTVLEEQIAMHTNAEYAY